MKIIRKIFYDTLTINGRFSRRSLTMFVSFALACPLSVFIVISDLFLPREINPYAWLVVGALLAHGTGQAILFEKEKQKSTETPIEQIPPQ